MDTNVNAVANAVAIALTAKFGSMLSLKLNEKVVDDKGDKEFKEIATVSVPCPTVTDFGLSAVVKIDDETKQPEYDEGLPVYTDDTMNWLQSAIVNMVKAQTRNKFVKGVLKPDAKLAETFEELTAVSERSGEALKARHEARRSFMSYLEVKGKSTTVVKLLGGLFGDANSIAVAKDDYVTALGAHTVAWIGTLNETDKVRYGRTIETLQEAINGRNTSLEDLN